MSRLAKVVVIGCSGCGASAALTAKKLVPTIVLTKKTY